MDDASALSVIPTLTVVAHMIAVADSLSTSQWKTDRRERGRMYFLNRLALTVVLSCASESAIAQTPRVESEYLAAIGVARAVVASDPAAGDARSPCSPQAWRVGDALARSRG